ncbi:GL17182 [Drosophila persimilis]|uniref:GL17182 n=1 Tax=Drosophila persimilis TaxID=7234 RepID=B4HCI7_DROPE|nr:GL17182 [Drosophila persimilis]
MANTEATSNELREQLLQLQHLLIELPSSIRPLISIWEENDLDKLAKIADKINENSAIDSMCVMSTQPNSAEQIHQCVAARLTPPKKSKAHQEATCLENLSELGKILDEVQTRMMEKNTRHINMATRALFVRMKELHSNIIESSQEAAAGRSALQEGSDAQGLCPKCPTEHSDRRQGAADNDRLEERCRASN